MIVYKIIRPLLYIWFTLKYKPIIINNKYIPKKGGAILAGNHTNNLDCLLLGYSTKRSIRFVAKNELLKGIKKVFFKSVGIIPVNRKIKDKSVIPSCLKVLKKEFLLGIFPEGTINKTNNPIMPFKKGAIIMAKESGKPIIPFAINGNYKRGQIKIIFDKPYYIKGEIEKETIILERKVIELIKDLGDKNELH